MFQVYFEEELIGSSTLTSLDTGMSVAMGLLVPTPSYSRIKNQVIEESEKRMAGQLKPLPIMIKHSDGTTIKNSFITIDQFDGTDAEISIQVSDPEQWVHYFLGAQK